MAALRVQHRQPSEARAHADRGALDRDRRADRGQDVAHQGVGVARRGGVPLVAIARCEQRDPVPRQPTRTDAGGGEVRQPRQPVVLGPVVRGEQRQRLRRVRVGGAPHGHPDLRPKAVAPDRQLLGATRDSLGLEPPGRRVAREQQHGLLPERARRLVRVAGVAHALGVAVVVDDLELVLEPRHGRRGQLQPPLAVVAGVGAPVVGQRQVGAQPHGGVALVGVGEAEEHPLMMATTACAPSRA